MKKPQSVSHFLLGLLFETFCEHKKNVAILLLSLLLLSLSQSLLIVAAGPFIQILLSSTASTINLLDLFPQKEMFFSPFLAGITFGTAELSFFLPLLLILFAIGRGLAGYFYQVSVGDLALYVCKKYRDRLFLSIIQMPYLTVKEKTSAQWMSILMNDVIYLQNRLLDIVNACVRDFVTMLACLVTLFFIHWPIAVLLLCIGPFIARGVGGVGEKISLYARFFQEKMGLIADYALELRKRFSFIRAQQGEATEIKRFHEISEAYYNDVKKSILIRASFAPCIEFMGFFSFALIIWFATRTKVGWFHPSNLFIFFGALGAFLKPLRNLGEQLGRFKETIGALQGSLPIMLRPVIAEEKSPVSDIAASLPIFIEHASFHMAEGKGIEASNLILTPGLAIAIIGTSGGGKSTLLRGLAGLIAPSGWTGSCQWSSLAKLTTYVSQEPFLFNESISENLQYGNPLFTELGDSTRLHECLRRVYMEAEVEQFQFGLEERIHPLHMNISGGQKQRMVLARSLLHRKKIMLWDEATSAISTAMEKDILNQVIQTVKDENTTLIAATHRLETLPLFDQVWFIKKGRVVLRGAHHDLLSEPIYREFFEKNELHSR